MATDEETKMTVGRASGLALTSWLAVVVFSWTGASAAPTGQPPLHCAVLSKTGVEQPPDQVVQVSNLRRIPLVIRLSKGSLAMEPLSVVSLMPGSGQAPTVSLVATLSSGGQQQAVPVKVQQIGSRLVKSEEQLSVLLEIPVDDQARASEIRSYLQEVETAASAEGLLEEFKALTADETAAIQAFERIYVSNRPGLYAVTCRYSSRRSGFWNGELVSAPIRVEVTFQGKFFDQPRFSVTAGTP